MSDSMLNIIQWLSKFGSFLSAVSLILGSFIFLFVHNESEKFIANSLVAIIMMIISMYLLEIITFVNKYWDGNNTLVLSYAIFFPVWIVYLLYNFRKKPA